EVIQVLRSSRRAWRKLTAYTLLVVVLSACHTINSVGVPTSDISALIYAESYPDGATVLSAAMLRGLRPLELAADDRLRLGFAGAPAETDMWLSHDVYGNTAYLAKLQTEGGDVLRIEFTRSADEDAPQSLVMVEGAPVAVSATGL